MSHTVVEGRWYCSVRPLIEIDRCEHRIYEVTGFLNEPEGDRKAAKLRCGVCGRGTTVGPGQEDVLFPATDQVFDDAIQELKLGYTNPERVQALEKGRLQLRREADPDA